MRELALLQTALPLAMILWLAFGRAPGRTDFALRAASAWLLLAGVALAGMWLALPWRTFQLLALLLIGATLIGAARIVDRQRPQGRALGRWAGRIGAAAALLLGAWLTVPALAGRSRPADAVDLDFPFRSGRWLVANGGSTERINGHFMTLGPKYRDWRGQSHAVDLIRVDAWGFRTRERRLLAVPADPADYLSFGEPVHAPCSGMVEAMEQGRADMKVPIRDREHLLGNFVLLRCGPRQVFLGHFRKGSILVAAGRWVQSGERLGLVGNSGNTDEPHLHIHVQEAGERGLAQKPYFLTFAGRFPVRNAIIHASGDQR